MTADDVLAYWFAAGMEKRWFVKDESFDAEVRATLGTAHAAAAAGALEVWRDTARGSLALVILLDQVPRNLYRDDPRAFASDAKARAVTRQALERGFEESLSQSERHFLYLPLEHSEDLADLEDCVRLVASLDQDLGWLDYAVQHRDIISRFGRYPHRNHCLGRATTAEEAAFLETPDSSF